MRRGHVDNWLPIFNQISLALFSLLMLAGLGRMWLRVWRLHKAHLPIDRILKRDIALFGTFFIVFGIGGVVARLMHIVLTTNPVWVVGITFLALISAGYWVWVEYNLEAPIEDVRTKQWTI